MAKLVAIFNKFKAQILYLIFGVSSTLVNIIVYYIMHRLGSPYQFSYWMAWFWAVLFAYLTNRVWVFNSKATGIKQISMEVINFYLARILTGLIGIGIMYIGVSLLHQNDLLWNLIQNVFVILTNYALSKWFIFQAKEQIKK